MKKRKILPGLLAAFMAVSVVAMPVQAVEGPIITNPSFEKEIDKSEVQLYKAVRTDEKAYDGKYSIKIGMEQPKDESQYPIWFYNYGKGSVNVIFHNVEPNTTYKITTHYYNATGVKMSTGVLDVEGQHTSSPWKLKSSVKTDSTQSTDWETHEHTITTGPRTNEIYGFAYTDWTGKPDGTGMFYVDDFSIEKVETKNVKPKPSINYTIKDSKGFPETIPAIQEFKEAEGSFKLNPNYQVFSTDEFSQAKTEYLAECMKDKGIIKDYTIKTIKDVKDGEGIVVVKDGIAFNLPENITKTKADAYQIDVTNDKVVVYSDYIEGIQNGTMTLLQAFTQRKVLPAGSVHDYTDQVVRGLQVDSGRRYYTIDWLKTQIEQMAYYKQNKLQLRLKDNEGIRYESKVAAPMVDRKGGFWTQKEVDELVNYAAKFNIEVIPEIDFPGHAEQDAAYYKDWGLGGSTKALDFSKKEVREYMINVYKEAADFFHAKTIHIGGDEFFQAGYTSEGREILTNWVRQETGNQAATDKDAFKLFMNTAANELFKKDLNVLMWNDNIWDLGGAVPLDKRITVDVWAGTIYGSIKGSTAANAGYNIMSSSSGNYHDLWPLNDKLDRPLPKNLYKDFTRYTYSGGFNPSEILTENLDKSLGQMFPIWDDAHGYVPEYILSRTLFPRYAVFAQKTWGAEYKNTLDYEEFERLIYALESPVDCLYEQSKINYNTADLQKVIAIIQGNLETRLEEEKDENVKQNIIDLNTHITEILNSITVYTDSSLAALQDALTEAKAVMANDKATQQEVDQAVEKLNEAMNNLVFDADKTTLKEAIARAEKLDESQYTKATWAKLVEALENAKKVDEAKEPTQAEVDAAEAALVDAINALGKKPNKNSLKYVISACENYKEEDYTPESWAPFAEALAKAKEVMADESDDLTQQEVQQATNRLSSARWSLVKKTVKAKLMARAAVDKSVLEETIRMAESYFTDQYVDASGFTTETINDLIYRFENLDYTADYGKVTVQYVDEEGNEIAEPEVLEGEAGETYTTAPVEVEGYTLKTTPDNANGRFALEDTTVIYVYAKDQESIPWTPIEPSQPKDDSIAWTPLEPAKPVEKPDTADTTVLGMTTLFLLAGAAGITILRKRKED